MQYRKRVIPMDITVSEDIDAEFLEEVEIILKDGEFKKLSRYIQHKNTTRLMHSINVSYISWVIAKKTGCDARAAARAGILHDFCLFDFDGKSESGEAQVFHHPKAAAKKSQEHFEVSEKEQKAILTHMFPLGPLPSSKEAWIISCADKFCACVERFHIAVALARRNRIVVGSA